MLGGLENGAFDLNTMEAGVVDVQEPFFEQIEHGGQELPDLLVADLSVTTNGLGPPAAAVRAASAAMQTIEHYPPLTCEPALGELARVLGVSSELVVLGNGASELIDLLIRDAAAHHAAMPRGSLAPGWAPGPSRTQYKEYSRSATAAGFAQLPAADVCSAKLHCIVNPSNPTGDFLGAREMRAYIETVCARGSHVLVDESMLMWLGHEWRAESLVAQGEWLRRMHAERGVTVVVLHSWTKIWACPGLRIGSCVCPTAAVAQRVRARQVPWSLNSPALAFLSAAITDEAYLTETWACTPNWNSVARAELLAAFPGWRVHGQEWCSWLWVDTGDERALASALAFARNAGLPLRSGAAGYDSPTCFRMAVRAPIVTRALVAALCSPAQTLPFIG
jgi:histidinol-phosphate/aromatic aminotransferase/cobyric acid decarboxylase-like protein